MVYLYIIINRIIFYDQCFTDKSDSDSGCFIPKCEKSEKPYYDFSSGKCVAEPDEPDEPDQPIKKPDEPDEPDNNPINQESHHHHHHQHRVL